MVLSSAAKAYMNVGIESGVQAVSPAKLVLMLYDGALAEILEAQRHMAAGNIAEKGRAVSKAISIIDSGLAVTVDTERGGDIAVRLQQLYDYMCRRLALANLKNDPAGLAEVSGLLRDLRGAWSEIAHAPPKDAVAIEPPPPPPPRDTPQSRVHAVYSATP
jgi:flagellar protein FliS